MRVGITGYATAGKDVIADVLTSEFDFVKVNMSDPLDHYLQVLDPIVTFWADHNIGMRSVGYRRMREKMSYTDAKKNVGVRRLLQRLGTDVGRDIDPDMWVKVMVRNTQPWIDAGGHTVTTGIRFANEAAAMDRLIYVHRPGVGPANDHPSEDMTGVFAQAHLTITNNGTVDDLRDIARMVAADLVLGPVFK
jgi:hypothetical protein